MRPAAVWLPLWMRPAPSGARFPLLPGLNDVVVDAADAAGNSGSTGVRVTRTGSPSTLRVVPQVLSVVIGQTRSLQVLSEYGPVRDVTWSVDNSWVAEVSDETSMLTPRAPGDGEAHGHPRRLDRDRHRSCSSVIAWAVGATRWRNGGTSVVQAGPPTGQNEGPPDPPTLGDRCDPTRPAVLTSTDSATGSLLWSEAAAISIGRRSRSRFHKSSRSGACWWWLKDATVRVRHWCAADRRRWGCRGDIVRRAWLGHQLVQDGAGLLALIEWRT